MPTNPKRHIPLDAAFNVRDLGGYRTMDGATTRWGSLLRADALHELTERDVDSLLAYGVRTVVDLRSEKEISAQPSRFAVRSDIRYHHISLFDGLAPVDMMFQQRGMFDLSERYVEAVETCRPAMLAVATAIAHAHDGVVLFNCTAGKDRTGIIAAMMLSIAGVSHGEIAADYALTATLAAPLMQRLRDGAMKRGLEEAMATRLLSSERTAMEALLRHVDDRHGGFRGYLVGEPLLLTGLEDRVIERACV